VAEHLANLDDPLRLGINPAWEFDHRATSPATWSTRSRFAGLWLMMMPFDLGLLLLT